MPPPPKPELPFNVTSPAVLLSVFLTSAVTVFIVCYCLLRPQRGDEQGGGDGADHRPFDHKTDETQRERVKRSLAKGKRKRRFAKKEIRAMEMEERQRARQEKKDEAKLERHKLKKVNEGGRTKQLKMSKFAGVGASGAEKSTAGTHSVISIPRKRN